MERFWHILLVCILVAFALMILCCFVRVIKGPKISDRIVGINMIGTLTILSICVLAMLLEEAYLVDVAMIYAMISFLAVVVLTRVYMGVYLERMERKRRREEQRAAEAAQAAEKSVAEGQSLG